jgi:hypothetical protein
MEPLSALGIAAAGVQFVDFATRLLSDAVKTYKSASGQTERVSILASITNDLTSLATRVEEQAVGLPERAPLGSPDSILLQACQQCRTISQELSSILQTLSARQSSKSGTRSARQSLTAAIRGIASEGKIKDLSEKLQTIQQQMQMAALMSLWRRAQEDGQTLSQAARQQLDLMETLGRIDATTKSTATYLQDLVVDALGQWRPPSSHKRHVVDDKVGPQFQ